MKIAVKYLLFLFWLLLCNCSSRSRVTPDEKPLDEAIPEESASTETSSEIQSRAYTLEDTIRYQIGGELHYRDLGPADSITVIESRHYQIKNEGLYREYRYINHNRYSPAHHYFEEATLDSVYKSYWKRPDYTEFYERYLHPRLDSISSKSIDPVIKRYKGYWVYLTEYKGEYYLDDVWDWRCSFHISDSILTHHYMDGPFPEKIVEAVSTPEGGISILYDGNNLMNLELLESKREIYRSEGGGIWLFMTPARNIHSFEIIEYANNTGDMISW